MTNKIKDLDKVKIGFADIKIERVDPSFKNLIQIVGVNIFHEKTKLKYKKKLMVLIMPTLYCTK